jgi:hypothetical protein
VRVGIDETWEHKPPVANRCHSPFRVAILDPAVDYEQIVTSLFSEEYARILKYEIHVSSKQCVGARE